MELLLSRPNLLCTLQVRDDSAPSYVGSSQGKFHQISAIGPVVPSHKVLSGTEVGLRMTESVCREQSRHPETANTKLERLRFFATRLSELATHLRSLTPRVRCQSLMFRGVRGA